MDNFSFSGPHDRFFSLLHHSFLITLSPFVPCIAQVVRAGNIYISGTVDTQRTSNPANTKQITAIYRLLNAELAVTLGHVVNRTILRFWKLWIGGLIVLYHD